MTRHRHTRKRRAGNKKRSSRKGKGFKDILKTIGHIAGTVAPILISALGRRKLLEGIQHTKHNRKLAQIKGGTELKTPPGPSA